REGLVRPVHAWLWQVAFGQRMADLHVGPADQGRRVAALAFEQYERLDAGAAWCRLDRTIFRQQRRIATPTIDAEQRPVVLLAQVGARVQAGGQALRARGGGVV